ncbi:MAG: polyphosphate kinase 2 family protein [Atopobiaceae bacterium]|jgi:PPK2 family polyphosphate:nucleotide phosphotransferase|nr:polyphosphate kinase 2 family protein [Atopobiaceae bacterium]MCI2172966.1 polyphosphate kinase 2 family protein [Atopobiaceae bacterium]MCI2208371.1 polyphosphate kinase 2 family protein [Atopobiaceae bacterium]
MDLKDCLVDGHDRIRMEDLATSAGWDKSLKPKYVAKTAENNQRMGELQDRLYADGHEGIVILLQAMDAAGKDSTVKHVMSGINPQGVDVTSFKQPSSEELAHDYLWRAAKALPRRGKIALFNRSYYEDVLVVRVHELQKGYAMPKRCVDMDPKEFFERRYRQISDFEEYLYENGYRVLKLFLNVGLDEQKARFLDRIDDESKNWKFSATDLKERALWPSYMQAYEDAINGTATKHCPWYVLPADQKWVTRWLVSEAIVDVLEDCHPSYPTMPDEQKAHLEECKAQLLATPKGKTVPDATA